ncbi:hypothetical protein J2858_003590 [Neorhizobium galegae]|uniref:ArnT family glycosyltransferase n=1 Tax=Neorhizobium galegae TaxID=399 RepID=UPI001AE4EA1A|nr:hypothetical protein [Neorhizobium galegae]MBP2550650.1 hypothetical protein [Neorhizobium galegae]
MTFAIRYQSALALVVFAVTVVFAVRYAAQPPLDMYAFRQTQTAISAYWFLKDGFQLGYETPVLGAPWAIPFEFPIYQILVALVTKYLGVPLDVSGRMISYLFLVACVIPVKYIIDALKLNRATFFIFSALFLSSPIYLYWGRSFMIETAALFFTLCYIVYFTKISQGDRSWRIVGYAILFATLGMLQKSTTMLPVFVVTACLFLVQTVVQGKIREDIFSRRNFCLFFLLATLPIAIGVAWVSYTDHLKLLNQSAVRLTSANLSAWNWGTLAQRFDPKFYGEVIWSRVMLGNMGGILGPLLLMVFVGHTLENRRKTALVVAMSSLAMGLLPFFMFTNLHMVHTYYQSANVLFLIFSVAVALGHFSSSARGSLIMCAVTTVLVISNYVMFSATYYPAMAQRFTSNDRDYSIGLTLRATLPDAGQFVAYGNDWSSTIGYMAQRKSLTVPNWLADKNEPLAHPEKYLDADRFGAVVSCPPQGLQRQAVLTFAQQKGWNAAEVSGCILAVAPVQLTNSSAARQICQGAIDEKTEVTENGIRYINIKGWLYNSANPQTKQYTVFASVDGSSFVSAVRMPRTDVNDALKLPEDDIVGYSVLIPTSRGLDAPASILVADPQQHSPISCTFN